MILRNHLYIQDFFIKNGNGYAKFNKTLFIINKFKLYPFKMKGIFYHIYTNKENNKLYFTENYNIICFDLLDECKKNIIKQLKSTTKNGNKNISYLKNNYIN